MWVYHQARRAVRPVGQVNQTRSTRLKSPESAKSQNQKYTIDQETTGRPVQICTSATLELTENPYPNQEATSRPVQSEGVDQGHDPAFTEKPRSDRPAWPILPSFGCRVDSAGQARSKLGQADPAYLRFPRSTGQTNQVDPSGGRGRA